MMNRKSPLSKCHDMTWYQNSHWKVGNVSVTWKDGWTNQMRLALRWSASSCWAPSAGWWPLSIGSSGLSSQRLHTSQMLHSGCKTTKAGLHLYHCILYCCYTWKPFANMNISIQKFKDKHNRNNCHPSCICFVCLFINVQCLQHKFIEMFMGSLFIAASDLIL